MAQECDQENILACQNASGDTALHLAARHGHGTTVEALFAARATASELYKAGVSLLYLAVMSGRWKWLFAGGWPLRPFGIARKKQRGFSGQAHHPPAIRKKIAKNGRPPATQPSSPVTPEPPSPARRPEPAVLRRRPLQI
uniref:Uncharacterized protein n=1 Tax=Leersia perrieri TaxID=77586 RepID=A0A0D9XPR2_9ORYZ